MKSFAIRFFSLFLAVYSGGWTVHAQNAKWAAVISCKNPIGTVKIDYVKMDKYNNVYVVGKYEKASVYFTPTDSIQSSGPSSFWGNGLFIAKYNKGGQFLWSKKIPLTGSRYYRGFEVSPEGDIWLCAWGNDQKVAYDDLSIKVKNTYVVRFNTDGEAEWISDGGDCEMMDIDAAGNTYVYGDFKDSTRIGNIRIEHSGEARLFMARLNADGALNWAKYIGRWSNTTMCSDRMGNVYMAGRSSGTYCSMEDKDTVGPGKTCMVVTKYHSDGTFGWMKLFAATNSPYIQGADADPQGNLLLTGYVNDSLWLGPYFFRTEGRDGASYFTAKLDGSGKVIWADHNNQGAGGYGVYTEPCGGFYVRYKHRSAGDQIFKDITLPQGDYLLYYDYRNHIRSAITIQQEPQQECVGPEVPDLVQAGNTFEAIDWRDTIMHGQHLSSISGPDGHYGYILYFDRSISRLRDGCIYNLSTEEIDLAATIYPNPVLNYIYLEFKNPVNEPVFSLCSLDGRIVCETQNLQTNGTGAKIALPPGISSGVYLLKVKNGQYSKTFKLFVNP